jgi:hypothetical protein
MMSQVDFNAEFLDFTLTKKFKGSFTVEWLLLKDIENSNFKGL